MTHLAAAQLEAGLDDIRQSPSDDGFVRLIVRRPQVGEREIVDEAALDPVLGMIGDSWSTRRSPHPEMQLTLMNARAAALIAQDQARWPLAGDQLFVDLSLAADNVPAGTRLTIGAAVVEVTAVPHTGCSKFVARFGMDAMQFVNSRIGRSLGLRGINAKVIRAGIVRVGDTVSKTGALEVTP